MLASLAFKNIISAGLRTWLNVFVLSVSFVVIIWTQGFYKGIFDYSKQLTEDYDIAAGQYWNQSYDPYNMLNINDVYSDIPNSIVNLVEEGEIEPILIRQGSIYPDGRLQSVLMKGIDPKQRILKLPTQLLEQSNHPLPILIGKRMAKQSKLAKGDVVMIRWRDAKGGFDAAEAKVVDIMQMDVPSIDSGQIWLAYDTLTKMMILPNKATILTLGDDYSLTVNNPQWVFKSQDELLIDLKAWQDQENGSASILYVILMALAIIGIFDAQIFSLFKRRKEIGTLMAMGMTRKQIIQLFSIEGIYTAFFASILAMIYGLPLCYWTAKNGIDLGQQMDNYSMAIGNVVFPHFSIGIVVITTVIIFITVALFSYLPLRRINRLKPTDALRGKWS